jgi:hypothetical protein
VTAASVGDDAVVSWEANGFPYRALAISSTVVLNSKIFVGILGANSQRYSTARGKLRGDDCFARRTCFHEIIQDAVSDGFVERAFVSIRSEIKLERFALDAKPLRHVVDVDPGEIGLAGNGTKAGEIVRLKIDVVIPARRIWKCFQSGFRGRGRQFRFAPAEQRQRSAFGFRTLHRLNVQRSTANLQPSNPMAGSQSEHPRSEDRVGVIDMIAHDPKTDEAVLVMNEPGPWDGSGQRLLELQERFNAYVSFLLDGEFAEWDPKLAQKRARIEVRCAHLPDARAIDLLGNIHDQLAHQEIKVEVVVKEKAL